jgi:hypothetical protein
MGSEDNILRIGYWEKCPLSNQNRLAAEGGLAVSAG